jgi:putative transcriptional regulator
MTQAQLAERVGVTRQTVIAIEQGRYSPSLEMAFQIARGVRCGSARCFSTPTARNGRDEGRKPPDIGGKKTAPAASLTARPAPSFPYYP